jgi:hypothetical protein
MQDAEVVLVPDYLVIHGREVNDGGGDSSPENRTERKGKATRTRGAILCQSERL